MKILYTILLGLLVFDFAQGQNLNPVSWDFSAEKASGDEFLLKFKATVQSGWYIYAQDIGEDGPIPTSVNFDNLEGFELIGEVEEKGRLIEKYSDFFGMQIKKYANEVVFQVSVRLTDGSASIAGNVEYMSCDDSRCLPPTSATFLFELADQ